MGFCSSSEVLRLIVLRHFFAATVVLLNLYRLIVQMKVSIELIDRGPYDRIDMLLERACKVHFCFILELIL